MDLGIRGERFLNTTQGQFAATPEEYFLFDISTVDRQHIRSRVQAWDVDMFPQLDQRAKARRVLRGISQVQALQGLSQQSRDVLRVLDFTVSQGLEEKVHWGQFIFWNHCKGCTLQIDEEDGYIRPEKHMFHALVREFGCDILQVLEPLGEYTGQKLAPTGQPTLPPPQQYSDLNAANFRTLVDYDQFTRKMVDADFLYWSIWPFWNHRALMGKYRLMGTDQWRTDRISWFLPTADAQRQLTSIYMQVKGEFILAIEQEEDLPTGEKVPRAKKISLLSPRSDKYIRFSEGDLWEKQKLSTHGNSMKVVLHSKWYTFQQGIFLKLSACEDAHLVPVVLHLKYEEKSLHLFLASWVDDDRIFQRLAAPKN